MITPLFAGRTAPAFAYVAVVLKHVHEKRIIRNPLRPLADYLCPDGTMTRFRAAACPD